MISFARSGPSTSVSSFNISTAREDMQLEECDSCRVSDAFFKRGRQNLLVHMSKQLAKPGIRNFDEILEGEHLVANRSREVGVFLFNPLKDVRRNFGRPARFSRSATAFTPP